MSSQNEDQYQGYPAGPANPGQPAPPEAAYPEPQAPAVSPYVILVVEDDALTRRAVGRKLQTAGYEVVLVPTASDALIVAQRMSFHVLVLDLFLPDMSDPFNGIYEGFS